MGHNKLNQSQFLRYVNELTQSEQLTLHCTIVENLRERRPVSWEGQRWKKEEAKVLQSVLEAVINRRLTQGRSEPKK